MKRVERCSLEDTRGINQYIIAEHIAHYRLFLSRLKGKVLDAGSGEGFGVDIMRKSGIDAWGIDLSPDVVAPTSLQYGPYYRQGSITQIPFEADSFDSITCMEVIEHVPETDAIQALKEMYRILRPGGLLILSTPNGKNSIGSAVNDYHFKEYTSLEMKTLLQDAGFRNIETYGLVCSNTAIQRMSKSNFVKIWMKVKHAVGLNRPLGNMGHVMEKVLTGHTTKNILEEDCWSLSLDDNSTTTMILISSKPSS